MFPKDLWTLYSYNIYQGDYSIPLDVFPNQWLDSISVTFTSVVLCQYCEHLQWVSGLWRLRLKIGSWFYSCFAPNLGLLTGIPTEWK